MKKEQYTSEMIAFARKASRFHLNLFTWWKWEVPIAMVKHACSDVIVELVERAEECYVYGQDQDSVIFQRHRNFLTPHKGKLRFECARSSVIGHEEYWGAEGNQRGTIAIKIKGDVNFLRDIFTKMSDPYFLNNLATIAGTSAIRFARKIVQEPDAEWLVFIFSFNQGLRDVALFAPTERIEELLLLAFENCKKTDWFEKTYWQ